MTRTALTLLLAACGGSASDGPGPTASSPASEPELHTGGGDSESPVPDTAADTGELETGGTDSPAHTGESGALDSGADTGTPDPCAPDAAVAVEYVQAAPSPTQLLGLELEVELSAPAQLGIACTNRADPSDRLFWELEASASFRTALYGLAEASSYSCAVAPTCPQALGPPSLLLYSTPSAPEDIGRATITHSPTTPSTGPGFLGINHWRYCDGAGPQRLVVYDLDGRIRWLYEDIPTWIDMGIQFEYLGSGQFAWGGGNHPDAAVRLVDVSGVETYATSFTGSSDLYFHHDGRVLDDGRILTLTHSDNVDEAGNSWIGFGLQIHRPGVGLEWSWDSQQAVDAGSLPTGAGDVYHANWADHVVMADGSERVYVSLCYLYQVIAIDVATGEVLFTFGRNGDFSLQTSGGEPLAPAAFSQCQHGLEVDGDRILFYDNGWERGASRASEYQLDEASRTATLLWTFEDDPWWETALGDADYLPGGHAMVTQAHTDCWGPLYGDYSAVVEFDPATGDQAWRFEFDHVYDTTYRSERMEACDIFPVSAWCPEVEARLEELSDLFEACDGDDDDLDGYSGCDGDCDDRDASIYPGAPEACDGVDRDCDGSVDDGPPEDPSCYGCVDAGAWLACEESMDWFAARDTCTLLGATLVHIDDEPENLAVADLLTAETWIGASDHMSEGIFRWTDGSPIGWSQWYAGEPNDWGAGEDCAGLNYLDRGAWNDYPCGSDLPFVCEW